INVRDAGYQANGDLSIDGGDLIARELNLNSGGGVIYVKADNLVGTLTTRGYEARVYTNTDTLVLGTIKLDGDPTYYNTGNIVISRNISVNEKLAIIAGGNITSDADGATITARGGGQGFDIHLIAGADLTAAPGTPSTFPTEIASGDTVTVHSTSPPGGNIDF